jgi:hypothetical protein
MHLMDVHEEGNPHIQGSPLKKSKICKFTHEICERRRPDHYGEQRG